MKHCLGDRCECVEQKTTAGETGQEVCWCPWDWHQYFIVSWQLSKQSPDNFSAFWAQSLSSRLNTVPVSRKSTVVPFKALDWDTSVGVWSVREAVQKTQSCEAYGASSGLPFATCALALMQPCSAPSFQWEKEQSQSSSCWRGKGGGGRTGSAGGMRPFHGRKESVVVAVLWRTHDSSIKFSQYALNMDVRK